MHHAEETPCSWTLTSRRRDVKTNALSTILNLLFPLKCSACGEIISEGALCEDCLAKLEEESRQRCPNCRGTAESCVCSEVNVRSLAFYGGYKSEDGRVTERLIYAIKRDYDRALTDFLAERLARLIKEKIAIADGGTCDYVLTFPPRSEKNLRKYGFDHVELLCRRVSKLTGIRLERMLRRVGGTEQKTLDVMERNENAVSTLFLRRDADPSGKRFIVIDDVVTTGATVGYVSRLLKRGDAAEVRVISVARTIKK